MENRKELLRGTEEEVRMELDCRYAQGFDGNAAELLSGADAGKWVLIGTPEEWYSEPGHGVDEGRDN